MHETPPVPTSTPAPAADAARADEIRLADLAVVVLNWNRKDDTLTCLDSVAAADRGDATVWVVDNGSHDGSVAAIRERHPWVRLIELSANEGFAGGNNVGIRAALAAGARGGYFLNNHTRLAPGLPPPPPWVLHPP